MRKEKSRSPPKLSNGRLLLILAYIANLGKYNEGYLVGAWFTFPIDEEDVKEKIGLNEQYEEYAIHDTDNFPIAIGEYVSIEELNSSMK